MQFPAREIHFRTRARAARNITRVRRALTSLEEERESRDRDVRLYGGESWRDVCKRIFHPHVFVFMVHWVGKECERERERGNCAERALK